MNTPTHPIDPPDDQWVAHPARILFLGNSITYHAPKPDIGWTGDWGMAASAREKDFAHLLLRRFSAAAGGRAPEARIENIADFERGYAGGIQDAWFDDLAAFQTGILILAIGENVADLASEQNQGVAHPAGFQAAVSALIARVARQGKVYVRSCFWPDPLKDAALRGACAEAGGTFVDISHLHLDEKNYARSEQEFEHSGVAAHPGDAGMAAIADAIWQAINSGAE